MKFTINEIRLWLKEKKEPRIITFQPDKVNVITGNSSTGKSSIITIIDYCLLGSDSKIVEAVINENVEWYGLKFTINGKEFFIARRKLINQLPSDEVYFSSNGEIPLTLKSTISIPDLRSILEKEFSLDENLVIPYGGKKIKAGSKISYRYFLLFNTQSSNIILNPNVFFDYDLYDSDKYKEALDRIFDLIIGVDTVENVLIKDKIQNLDSEIIKITRKQKLYQKNFKVFGKEILNLVQKAQEFKLIDVGLFEIEEAHKRLKNLVQDYKEENISTEVDQLESFYKKKRLLNRKIRNLKNFESEYETYKDSLKLDYDSLKPIEYLKNNFSELITIPEIRSFITNLSIELEDIKNTIDNKKAFTTNNKKEINSLSKELEVISSTIDMYPSKTVEFKDSVSKYIFIGELKAKLAFYENDILESDDNESGSVAKLEKEIEVLKSKIQDSAERKSIILELLQERIQKYINECQSLGNYSNYKAYINYKKKILQLREPNSSQPSNIGSSSNHMFLHLFFFLGIHEHMINQKVPFVPSFLIFDQLSQPYYEEAKKRGEDEISDNDDRNKLTDAFKLLNSFVSNIKNELKDSFQIILLEHAPKEYWETNKFENSHLVEEFKDGNALIN